jgi:hypothetical protein
MPVLSRARGLRILFYANEGNPIEPSHLYAENDNLKAEFLEHSGSVRDYDDGFNTRTLRESLQRVETTRDRLERAWNDFTGLVSSSDTRHAGPREVCRISRRGSHWEALDEDSSVAGLLAGLGD